MALIINGEHVPDRTLDSEVLRLSSGLEVDAPEAGAIDPAQLRMAALHNVIDRTLLLQLATSRQMQVTAEEVQLEMLRRWGVERSSACDPASMEAIREDLLIDRVTAQLTRHARRPGKDVVAKFYRANLHHYRLPEAVDAAHILCGCVSKEEEELAFANIQRAGEELRGGTPFAKVADLYSDCKGVGGSVGWVARGSMVPEFEDVVFALAPNELSPVFRTVFGFHIATVKRQRSEGVIPLEQVKHAIAKRMHDQARSAALQQVLIQLRTESSIHYTESLTHG